MADALIAATAFHLTCPLVNANDRHYRFLEELELVAFQP
jgi:predicted nucleic acid-binding protein